MTALILQVTPFVEMVTPKLQAVYMRFLHAFDAFAEARMRKRGAGVAAAQSPARARSLSPADASKNKSPVKAVRTGR